MNSLYPNTLDLKSYLLNRQDKAREIGRKLRFEAEIADGKKIMFCKNIALQKLDGFDHIRTCQNRFCPNCTYVKKHRLQEQVKPMIEKALSVYPNSVFALLTLTVPNCPVSELRNEINKINKGFARLSQRKEFKSILGWVKFMEISRQDKSLNSHPHIHAILQAKSSFFKNKNQYVTNKHWSELWKDCYRSTENLHVKSRRIKPEDGDLSEGVIRTFSYCSKALDFSNQIPLDRKLTDTDKSFICELDKQTTGIRQIDFGGEFRNYAKSTKKMNIQSF